MKTRLKHMTAALLTLIMVIGMVPLNAFAWGTEGEVCSSKFGSAYGGMTAESIIPQAKSTLLPTTATATSQSTRKRVETQDESLLLPMPPARSIRYIALSPNRFHILKQRIHLFQRQQQQIFSEPAESCTRGHYAYNGIRLAGGVEYAGWWNKQR